MIRKIIFGLIITCFIVLSSYIVTAPIWYGTGDDTGLIGKWSCEGNFLDSSNQGNHGTQLGGVKITSGVKGRACGFDGVDDYINGSSGFASILTGTNPRTFSIWINTKANDLANAGPFASERTQVGSGRFTMSGNYIAFGVGNTTTAVSSISTTIINNTNRWMHIAGIYNGTHTLIYINGVLEDSDAVSLTPKNSTGILMGTIALSGSYWWNGSIDEVRIYNRTLSATEILALYNTSKSYHLEFKSHPTLGISNEAPAPMLTDESGLIGWWKFDNASGTNSDSSGSGYTLTLSGSAAYVPNGRFEEGAFSNTANGYFSAGNVPKINDSFHTHNLTYSIWFNTPSTQGDLIGTTGYNPGWGYSFEAGNTGNQKLQVRWKNSTDWMVVTSDVTYPLNTWTHGVFTYDGTTAKIYQNGALVKTEAATPTDYSTSATAVFQIMKHGWYQFNGTIDEARVYNRTLSASEVKELYLSRGLVGYWKMDASTRNTTDTYDSSGYNTYGKLSGATLTNEGRFKEGYKFDGVNDYVNITNSTAIGFTQNYTFSAWIKHSRPISAYYPIFWRGNTTHSDIELYIQTATNDTCLLQNRGAGRTLAGKCFADPPFNQWYHIAGVWNGTGWSLYYDGVSQSITASYDSPTNPLLAENYFANIGYIAASAFSWTPKYFNGTIDEVRIYNRALTSSEIAGLYNGTKSYHVEFKTIPSLGISNETPAPTKEDETGLVGHWKCNPDEGSNNTKAIDSSGSGNNGTITGSATITNNGRFGGGYVSSGNNQYISVSQGSSLNFSAYTGFTISLWLNAAGYKIGGVDSIFGTGNPYNANGTGFIFTYTYPTTDRMYLQLRNGPTGGVIASGYGAASNITGIGKWNHITVTFNRTENAVLYVNGANAGSISIASAANGSLGINPIKFCAYGDASGSSREWNGTIDEIRVYNRTLSASEVQELYLSKGLVGHWKMDGSTRNTTATYDSSGYYNHGTISGATLTNEGRFKEGYKFDGSNDYISITNSLSVNLSGNITVSSWVKTKDNSSYDGIISKFVDDSQESYLLYYDPNLNVFRWYLSPSGNNTGRVINQGTSQVQLNTWYHVAGTYNGTNAILYINGVQEDSDAYTSGIFTSTNPLEIGRYDASSDQYFNGTIDEVRIYNRALTSSEIAGLYNGTKSEHLTWWSAAG